MRNIIAVTLLSFIFSISWAQVPGITGDEWKDPSIGEKGTAPRRAEFISFDIRADANFRLEEKNPFYLPVELVPMSDGAGLILAATIEVPYAWLDRDLFLHVEGIPGYYLSVNNRRVGYAEDNRAPAEFLISPYVTDGKNALMITVEPEATGRQLEVLQKDFPQPRVYVYSQPKIRIEDFSIKAEPDSTWSHGVLTISLALSNSYNSPETVTVGYDIYAPEGKLQYYDMREITVPANGRDTLRFSELIYGTPANWWSAENPKLYHGMFTARRGNRMTEYIPYRVGFGTVGYEDGQVTRNGKPVEIKAVRYNAAPTREQTTADLKHLKGHGINTVRVDYPQPFWFYWLTDEIGLYVIDQANINSSPSGGNRNVGGAVSNDPAWVDSFTGRAEAAFARSRNHTSVTGWSLGGDSGNGYNMYKTYQAFKELDGERAVIYDDAQGEWNSDLMPVDAPDARTLLDTPLPKTPQPGRRR